MKYSQYNHFVEMENVVLCFNAYNYSRLIIGKNAYQDYLSCKDNVEKLNTKNPNLHRTLEANGFIVTDENDEQKKYLSSVQERKFSKDIYHIIVNPTMDCNLKCWYCYESHIEKSHMTSEMVAAIILHIKEKITKEPFKKLISSNPQLSPSTSFLRVHVHLLLNLQIIRTEIPTSANNIPLPHNAT